MRSIARGKEGCFPVIKRAVHQEDMAVRSVPVFDNSVKQEFKELQGERGSHLWSETSAPLSVTDREAEGKSIRRRMI